MATKVIDETFLGSELKLNVSISPVGTVTMDDYDFVAEFYCTSKKKLIIKKQDAIRIDEENFVFLIDTNEIGYGMLKCAITAYIPDADFPDSIRTETKLIETGIIITKI